MYSLNTLSHLNDLRAKAPKSETETTRHCSYAASPKGVVLHSAKRRSTAWLTPAKAKRFLVEWRGTNSQAKRDAVVESYFDTSPGKGLNN